MGPTQTSMALTALLDTLIDYAGLFPPAGLDMATAVANYAKYFNGEYAWMLGRFVVPSTRLQEFEAAWRAEGEPEGWRLSALVANREPELAAIQAFNAAHDGKIAIDAVEMKAASVDEIKEVPGLTGYVELPASNDTTRMMATLKREKLRAKLRTGGVKADAIPSVSEVARFMRGCAGMYLPFKATAGLHHPVRSVRPLRYEPGCEQGKMHGFLNVFFAAAAVRRGYANTLVEQVLNEEDPGAFKFDGEVAQWREAKFKAAEMMELRTKFAIAFGSCSFEEPIADLQALGLLP